MNYAPTFAQQQALAHQRSDEWWRTPHLPKAVTKRIDQSGHNALIGSASVTGKAFVTTVALTHLDDLTERERRVVQSVPIEDMAARLRTEARAAAIVDTFTMGAVDVIALTY